LGLVLTVVVFVQFGFLLAIPFVLASVITMLFFYDPVRVLPSHPLGVMSPVDGVVEEVELFYDPFLDRTTQRIRIHADSFRVYQARSPIEGTLKEYWPRLSEDRPGYDKKSVKGVWWLQTDEADDVIMVVESSTALGQIHCDIQAGERIGQARRCGRFPVVCYVDLLVEEHSFIGVEVGQHVQSGVHTLASFNREATETGQD